MAHKPRKPNSPWRHLDDPTTIEDGTDDLLLDHELEKATDPPTDLLEGTLRNRTLKGSTEKRATDAARKRLQRWRWRTGDRDDGAILHEAVGWVPRHNLDVLQVLFKALRSSEAVLFDPDTNCLRTVDGKLTSPRKVLEESEIEAAKHGKHGEPVNDPYRLVRRR